MTACTTITSPLGDLLLVGEESADRVTLTSLSMPGQRSAPAPRPGWRQIAEPFADVIRQLEAYFAGGLTRFDIPYGTTLTYGDIAEKIGATRAAVRSVGTAIGANPALVVRPCHRVIGAGGRLAGYAGGLECKQQLLDLENVHQAA
ncbi:methylated-DNA--[protein]-cysteine S-methyltransferase [Streptomyces sparsogenes]|nr:methylated-DNA--[protein]-cysteine S-methyltransferase [Streptomyces sparsogenes]